MLLSKFNEEDSRASITIHCVKDGVTESEVAAAMDVIIAKNIFYSTGGNLVSKHSTQVTERNVTELDIR